MPSGDLRRALRGHGHALSAIVQVGKSGVTEGLVKQVMQALADHELIKVKAPGGDREARDALFDALAARTSSSLVHRIGNVAVLYRPHPVLPRIMIPD